MITLVTHYRCSDGKTFSSEAKALEHERKLELENFLYSLMFRDITANQLAEAITENKELQEQLVQILTEGK